MKKINDDLKSLFEYELKTKLSLKSHSSTSEMNLLYYTFRYFDEKNIGLITKEKWPNVFIKLGLIDKINIKILKLIFHNKNEFYFFFNLLIY